MMYKDIQEKTNQYLWQTNLKQVSVAQRYVIQFLRIFYGAARDLGSGLLSLRAMGLVYTTLLSIVPLLAVSFSVLKGFGVHNQLEPALINLLTPLGEKGLSISQQIISFVDNIKVGVLGAVGLLVLVFTVLSLVQKIESAFNFTWRITTTRGITQRFSNYLSVILIGPLFLFTASAITASFNSSTVVSQVLAIEPFGTLLLIIGELVPYLLTIVSFTVIYLLIPNTKVKLGSAVYGAVFSTIAWKLVGKLFTAFIVNSTNYTAIYSGFAILIIFMIWIYMSWLIVLTGASIAYYHQNPDRISNLSQVIRLSCRLREKLALTVMQLIASSFDKGESPWTLNRLAKKSGIAEPALLMVLSALIKGKLLLPSGTDDESYLPAQSLDKISLHMILDAVRQAEESPNLRPDDVITVQKVNDTVSALEDTISDSTKNITLKDLI
ncbi:MAG: YihY/virulence factor BrkB family protein [Gammaproteobacteria bacterium]|nr:YihY/virulence factor BrkB family protein [Gammaproteobacteria bacterium]